jgi:hypothetical protein
MLRLPLAAAVNPASKWRWRTDARSRCYHPAESQRLDDTIQEEIEVFYK